MLALLLCAVMAVACSGDEGNDAVPATDGSRVSLIGAVPGDAANRGVYAFTAPLGDELSPGSLLAPVIGAALQSADLVVETGAPPLTLALGISEDAELPAPARRVGDVVVLGTPEDVAAAVARLESDQPPVASLASLVTSEEPVAWAGPPPTREPVPGHVLMTMDEDSVSLTYSGAPDPDALRSVVTQGLETGAPPQSPGKPWRTLLVEPTVTVGAGALDIAARRGDLPGSLLRQLIDSRSFTFLAGG